MPYRITPTIHFVTELCTGVDHGAPLSKEQTPLHAWHSTHTWGRCRDPLNPRWRYYGDGWAKLGRRRLPVLHDDPAPFCSLPAHKPAEEEPEACAEGGPLCGEDANERCSPLRILRIDRKRAHLARSAAVLAAAAEDIYADSNLESDLAIVRLLRATAVALAEGEHQVRLLRMAATLATDGYQANLREAADAVATGKHKARLQKMADEARRLLDADGKSKHSVLCTGFETLKDEEGDNCAQPFRAIYEIPSQDLVITGRKGRTAIARRLLAAAKDWPSFWLQRGHELIPGGPDGETPVETAARKTTESLANVLEHKWLDTQTIDPALGFPLSPGWAPESPYFRVESRLREHFSKTPRAQWADDSEARKVVLLFLEELGVPQKVRKNLFSFLDKAANEEEQGGQDDVPDDPAPASERRPRTPPPEGE